MRTARRYGSSWDEGTHPAPCSKPPVAAGVTPPPLQGRLARRLQRGQPNQRPPGANANPNLQPRTRPSFSPRVLDVSGPCSRDSSVRVGEQAVWLGMKDLGYLLPGTPAGGSTKAAQYEDRLQAAKHRDDDQQPCRRVLLRQEPNRPDEDEQVGSEEDQLLVPLPAVGAFRHGLSLLLARRATSALAGRLTLRAAVEAQHQERVAG
jgi:hypothetical protein